MEGQTIQQLAGEPLVQGQGQVHHPNVDHANLKVKPLCWSHVLPLLQTVAPHKGCPVDPFE